MTPIEADRTEPPRPIPAAGAVRRGGQLGGIPVMTPPCGVRTTAADQSEYWGQFQGADPSVDQAPSACQTSGACGHSRSQGRGASEIELLQTRPAFRQFFTSWERTLWSHEFKKSAWALCTPPETSRTPLREPLIL